MINSIKNFIDNIFNESKGAFDFLVMEIFGLSKKNFSLSLPGDKNDDENITINLSTVNGSSSTNLSPLNTKGEELFLQVRKLLQERLQTKNCSIRMQLTPYPILFLDSTDTNRYIEVSCKELPFPIFYEIVNNLLTSPSRYNLYSDFLNDVQKSLNFDFMTLFPQGVNVQVFIREKNPVINTNRIINNVIRPTQTNANKNRSENKDKKNERLSKFKNMWKNTNTIPFDPNNINFDKDLTPDLTNTLPQPFSTERDRSLDEQPVQHINFNDLLNAQMQKNNNDIENLKQTLAIKDSSTDESRTTPSDTNKSNQDD